MKIAAPQDRLQDVVIVRMFPKMKKEITMIVRKHKYRWPDESAFIRAACNKLILEMKQ